MKRITLFAAAMLLLATAANAQQSQLKEQYPSYIEVNGVAEREITPDKIYINITINERDSKGKITVEEQEQQMIAALKSLGIDTREDLKVSDMSSSKFKRKEAVTVKHYQLLITEPAIIGDVYDILQQIGITSIDIAQITHSEIDKYRAEVRKEAIANTRTTASELAEAIGQSIGKAFYIQYYNNSAYNSNIMRTVAFNSAKLADGTVIEQPEFKKIKLTASVNAKFVLE